jgi:DNA-directed RNA polymerase specialized sigma24 family protein
MANQIHEVGPRLKAGSIQKCLRTALTIISPAQSIDDVSSFEDNTEVSEERFLKSEENLRMERSQYGTRRYELARDVCEKLDSETLEIIFQKAHGANQSEIGEILGLTRQTARYRIEEAQQQLFNEFKVLELDIEESREVLGAMLDILGVRLSEVNA